MLGAVISVLDPKDDGCPVVVSKDIEAGLPPHFKVTEQGDLAKGFCQQGVANLYEIDFSGVPNTPQRLLVANFRELCILLPLPIGVC